MTSAPDREPARTDDRAGLAGEEVRDDLRAALHTRRDLGGSYEDELVDSFLEKVEQRIDSAVDKRVRRRMAEQQMVVARGGRPSQAAAPQWDGPGAAFGLAALSLVLAIPLSAIAGNISGLTGMLTCWAGIVGVNACVAGGSLLRRRERRERGEPDWD
jgi:hypothetical protein